MTADPKTYLGKRGYCIYKDKISISEQGTIRDDLMVAPYIPKSPAPPIKFPIYRESMYKLYVPRFYGNSVYGEPEAIKLDQPEKSNMKFIGELRPYQNNIVSSYHKNLEKGGGLLEIPCGRGKCLGINTPIMLYDGTIKMVQDIKVGDVIMGDDSTPRNILTLARGREQMYKVIPNKGDSYTVNESHILSLKYSSTVNKHTPKGTVRDIAVLDYLALPKSYHSRGGVLVGYRVPIQFPTKSVKIDPYLLGYWLGDGASKGTLITTQEACVLKYLTADCFKNKHPSLYLQYTGAQYDYRINSINKPSKESNELMNYLRYYNLIKNKHIPHDYKCNDRTTQLELLAGILDSDGSPASNSYDIIQKNETLLDDIIFLARSLGFAAYKSMCKKSCIYKGEKKEGTYYRATIHGKGLDEIPVKCPRKKVSPRKQIKDALNTRIKIEKLEVDNYYGFEIDGNHRFVLGDFTVTHNTVMALKIAADVGLKTLVIVHKGFLLSQWVERIEQFIPNAKIGKIQGKTIDIQGKDIVIGMLQSLSMKEYPEETFSSFGLTIVDEVHHIAAEVFVRSLFKIVTKYVLGLSATMNRKDGLSKVFKMFLGDIIYKETREGNDNVLVKAITYKTTDDEFNEVKYDYRGNPAYSTMISKLCNFNPRSEFILKVVQDIYNENTKQQIMILAHNKSLLKYFYDAIDHRKFASVGYYVGGMKEQALKESETKSIIIGTYAMASEALDIKTLTTLVMATPKTDITQAVGRILRTKEHTPLVVDIIDDHDVFTNQWKKRKSYYKKENYKIISCDSNNYNNTDYKTEFDPENAPKKGSAKKQRKCLIKL